MAVIDIIYSVADTQKDGRDLLNTIKVDMKAVENLYHSCDRFKAIADVKFDKDKLGTDGYSLQEILDISNGSVIESDAHRFVLAVLQSSIKKQEEPPAQ